MAGKSAAYLVLEDGTVFEGLGFGKLGNTIGQMTFNTGVTGCQELLTDIANTDKIVLQTFPLVGNYGLNDEDSLSDNVQVKGYIVREWCEEPSNFRCKYTLDEFMSKHNAVGLYNIDTRALTKKLVKAGNINGAIVTKLPKDMDSLLKEIKAFKSAAKSEKGGKK